MDDKKTGWVGPLDDKRDKVGMDVVPNSSHFYYKLSLVKSKSLVG